jgi:hypothetical protein
MSSKFFIITFFSIVILLFSSNYAFAAVSDPNCSLYTVELGCDLSGWMKLLMGDIGVGAVLAMFLHFLAHRQAKKTEIVIHNQESMRKRRQEFAVQTLRNHFTTLLFILGVMNRFLSKYNEGGPDKSKFYDKIRAEENRIEKIVQTIRNTLMYSNDALDPTFVNQVDAFCTFSQNLLKEENDKILMPKYDEGKKKILELTEKLKEFDSSNEIFR